MALALFLYRILLDTIIVFRVILILLFYDCIVHDSSDCSDGILTESNRSLLALPKADDSRLFILFLISYSHSPAVQS